MAQQSPDYKKLLQEELRKRQEAESAQKEAERAQQKGEEKTRKTTLPEFLDACHVHLHSGLTVQWDKTLSTKGEPANANGKIRPDRILAWNDFPTSQEAIWKDLQRSNFMHERQFMSIHTLEESGEVIRQRMISSELDLNHFERSTVEDHITSIIKQIYNNPFLRDIFCLQGSVSFENHGNTLGPEREMEENMQNLSIYGRRRSPRLRDQLAKPSESSASAPMAGAITGAAKATLPRADQFCVYNISNKTEGMEHRIAAFIIEYKAPHKLHLGCIYEGLKDMNLEEVVRCDETDGPQDQFRRLVAAAITQAFSYMVRTGLEYGYVCTGEAFIFLRVPDNPGTVYYFLSVPKGDVGETTGMASDANGQNRLHLTAVGQVLAFTLQALKRPPRSQGWQANAVAQLKTWEVVYDELLNKISTDDIPSSEYRPPRQSTFLRMSPIRLRPRTAPTASPGCQPPADERHYSDSEFDPDSDTPSRTYRQRPTQAPTQALDRVSKAPSGKSFRPGGGNNVQCCTQKCLRGLVEGGSLDKMCPNALDHGENHHQIDKPTFLNLIRQQLSKSLDIDCMPTGLHGARGALFIVRLTSHGYTLAAKCTTIDFIAHLKREAAIYEHLHPIQGTHVPVYLGNIDLDHPYVYDGVAEIVHMMFIGFGGYPVSRQINPANSVQITQQFERSVQAIHQLRVLHRDLMPRNILWNAKLGQIMIIDFERAEIQESRAILGAISPNRKRKWPTALKEQPDDVFMREIRRAMIELRVR
ncbi:MAG: hypothetical protein LQ347_004278 [Umbilicaria vellea]|nr:MAG: hypothetical protein LQ347_004278 [Umbilicaria vellea]